MPIIEESIRIEARAPREVNREVPTSPRVPALRGWLAIVILPAAVLLFTPNYGPRWVLMWSLAATIFAGFKWLTWRRRTDRAAPWWGHTGYLLAWPGLDAASFLGPRRLPHQDIPSTREWAFAAAKVLVGGALFWGLSRLVPADRAILLGWVGMAGLILMLHFGAFHLLSCFWRTLGVNARPLMNNPLAATSVSEFWGKRWNTAFRDLTHRFLFRPLTPWLGARGAIAAGFLFSGLVHDLVISIPAGGGYGWPTFFFLVQGLALLVERSRLGRALGLGRGWRGWIFTALCLSAPAYGLFHAPFLRRVVVPFMTVLGAGGTTYATMEMEMSRLLPTLITLAGAGQLSVLIASALVPFRLNWARTLGVLPHLHRQMYWAYGGYIVLAIAAFGFISLFNAEELSGGSGLARCICGYIALFWAVRLALQGVLDVKKHLSVWWLKLGYHMLTILFLCFTLIYGAAAVSRW